MTNKLIVCRHSRDLLISLIELYYNPNSHLVFIYDPRLLDEHVFSRINNIYKNSDRVSIFDESISPSTRIGKFLNKAWRNYQKAWFIRRTLSKRKLGILCCFTDAEVEYAVFRFFKLKIWLYEHGTVNYIVPPEYKTSVSSTFRSLLLYRTASYGYHYPVDRFFLFRPEFAPKKIGNKVYKLAIKDKFKTLSVEHKRLINQVFLNEEGYRSNSNGTTILLTQPLSEDGIISKKEKVLLYTNIITELRKEGNKIYLKPHPRENDDIYSGMGVNLLSKFSPFELLELNGLLFDKVVTIYSSACDAIEYPTEKVYLGVDCSQVLLKGLSVSKKQHLMFTKDYFLAR